MDFSLYALDTATGARASLPHGQQSRFHTEGEAVARAEELRGEAAARGAKTLPAFAVLDISGELVREIKDAAAPAAAGAAPDICPGAPIGEKFKCPVCGAALLVKGE